MKTGEEKEKKKKGPSFPICKKWQSTSPDADWLSTCSLEFAVLF